MYRWIGAALGLVVLVASACGSDDGYVIVRDESIGGFPGDGTVEEARDIFGEPTTTAPDFELCTITWKSDGIVMDTYASQNSGVDPCGPDGMHKSTTVTDERWRTSEGLAVGDRLADLRRLYPMAQDEGNGRWRLLTVSLAGLPVPSLAATIEGGRVAAFTLYGPRSPF
jgi:hypothetical protein